MKNEMRVYIECPLCQEAIPVLYGYMLYFIHLIDEHWDLIVRIHKTTRDEKARSKLNDELVSELGFTRGAF